MFTAKSGTPILDEKGLPLKQGKVKKVNLHNNQKFSDNGVQAKTGTACGTQPTITLSFGSSRTLTIERQVKVKAAQQWSSTNPPTMIKFELNHGSIFILDPYDEKPASQSLSPDTLHKTKHCVDFRGKGVSFAFVFRCVKRHGTFNRVTNQWIVDAEDKITSNKVNEHVRNKQHLYDMVDVNRCTQEKELIGKNIKSYVRTLF